jgi:hypothetical protein
MAQRPVLTWKLYCLAIDDKVRKLWCNLSAFFLILRKIKFFSQFHVINLSRENDTILHRRYMPLSSKFPKLFVLL